MRAAPEGEVAAKRQGGRRSPPGSTPQGSAPDVHGTARSRRRRSPGRPTGTAPAAAPPPGAAAPAVTLAERTADLQRLKAEYDNYRSRAHRDRLAIREIAVANVLSRLLPVLDAVAEAAKHGELTDGFRHVAEALETELAGLGLDDLRRGGRSLRPPYPQGRRLPPLRPGRPPRLHGGRAPGPPRRQPVPPPGGGDGHGAIDDTALILR